MRLGIHVLLGLRPASGLVMVALAASFIPLASASDSCSVQGKLLGFDGLPMRSAFVRPYGPARTGRLAITHKDGTFAFTLPARGAYRVALGGTFHKTLFLPLYVEGQSKLSLTVRLSSAEYVDHLDSVRVTGDFNAFDLDRAIPMVRRTDGTLAATVACEGESLHYQILGAQVGGLPLCGTQADTFLVDRTKPLLGGHSNSFISVISVTSASCESVAIVFDPSALPRGSSEPLIQFSNPRGVPSQIALATLAERKQQERLRVALQAFRTANGNSDSFHVAPYFKETVTAIAKTKNHEVRGYLLLNYFHHLPSLADSSIARELLTIVPPSSALWTLEWGGPENTLHALNQVTTDPKRLRGYVEAMVETNPDTTVRAGALYYLLNESAFAGDKARMGKYYSRLAGDYPATEYAAMSRKQFAPDRAIMKGKHAPGFDVPKFEDSTATYRNVDFLGQYVLIDFWATWCGPCIAEMPYLHRAWDAYKDRGLVILSVSFDEQPMNVRAFRRSKWAMPWPQGWVRKGFASETAAAFEILGIPRGILVDPEGMIVAVDEELRGARLTGTLGAVLAEKVGRK